MAKNLVIVESPAKANTIKKILGKNYEIIASYGHIRDLPKSKMGVDTENEFEPRYISIKGKGDVIKKIKQAAKKAEKVYLASDKDREGEAIAWHINNILNLKEKKVRIEFNEITKTAIKEAVKNPREIDMNRVYSQQARRILDRLVGYEITPILWKIVNSNTSAGRVQSVALKMICDLEDEIKNFISEKYWEVKAEFLKGILFSLYKIKDEKMSRIKDENIVKELKENIKDKEFKIIQTKISSKNKKPPLPLKTSTLQQLASSYLGYSASKTMRVAQTLYEGVDIDNATIGLITYMRTDSMRISDEAKTSAQKYIEEIFGKKYVGDYIAPKSKGKIQDAHEAIRPTDILILPESIKGKVKSEQYKLYKLIWERFMVSQFSNMEYQQFEVIAEYEEYQFRGIVNKVKFDGYYKIFKDEDEILTEDFPDIKEGDEYKLKKLDIIEGETKPPSRLTESSLVKRLESEEIGRPSTYAAIIETLKKREYINIEKKSFIPTELGYEVKGQLEKYFPNIMNIKFTALMEENLDKIEEGEKEWKEVLSVFYDDFKKYLLTFEEEVEKINSKTIYSDINCEKCGSKMILKSGRFGKYLECENYEECKERVSIKGINIPTSEMYEGNIKLKDKFNVGLKSKSGKITDMKCDKCNSNMVIKSGRFGAYLECEKYQECPERKSISKELFIKINFEEDIVKVKDLLEEIEKEEKAILEKEGNCEKCGKPFILKNGRFGKFLACSGYPECKNIKKLQNQKKVKEKKDEDENEDE